LLFLIGCSRTSYFTTYANGSEDDDIYINTDLHVSIQQKYASNLYPRYKPQKNNRIFNKSVKLHRLKIRSEILLYTEGYDENKDGSLVEYYPSGLSEKKLLKKLKRRNFLISPTAKDGMIRYEKEVNGYEYYFGERLEQLEKGTLRLVEIARKGKFIIPNIWTKGSTDFDRRSDSTSYSNEKLNEIEEAYVQGVKQGLWSRQMRLQYFDKLDEDKRFDEMDANFFQKDLQFNYSRLNIILNKALNDTIVKGDSDSRILAQTLLSYLSRNEDIYKIEASKSTVLDSIILESDIILADDFFAKIKEQDIRLLMINEAHYWSQCRYQANKLLDGLKDSGFNTIFLEGVSNDKVISFVEDVENDIGIYVSEPTFGNFLKKAITLGFTIYGYDVQPVDIGIKMRSKLQAENIVKIINSEQLLNPDSRAIVYYGATHVGLKGDRSKTLGEQLKKKLDAKILSIDQAELIGFEKILIKKKSLAKNQTYLVKSAMPNKGGFDYYLFESNSSYFSNTPDYVYNLGEFKVDIEKYFTSEVSFITIYTKPIYGSSSIPIFTCSRENRRNSLRLPAGAYFVRKFDESGCFLKLEQLSIE